MKIKKLKVTLAKKVLVDISLNIDRSLALVGQSGSGKSLSLKAILGMLPSSMECILDYEASFDLSLGKTISFVPQNPFTALSPLTKIKNQFFIDKEKQEYLFEQVGLDKNLLNRFPPELSGGQLQRVVIAMALQNQPKLILLDEPTTALDPETRILILDILKDLQNSLEFKILFVTHDISSAKYICEDICVIKDGLVVENGKMLDILDRPMAMYTKTLIQANFGNREFRN